MLGHLIKKHSTGKLSRMYGAKTTEKSKELPNQWKGKLIKLFNLMVQVITSVWKIQKVYRPETTPTLSRFGSSQPKLEGPRDSSGGDNGQETNVTVFVLKTTDFAITGGETIWTGQHQKI